MNVRELIERLEDMPADAPVFVNGSHKPLVIAYRTFAGTHAVAIHGVTYD